MMKRSPQRVKHHNRTEAHYYDASNFEYLDKMWLTSHKTEFSVRATLVLNARLRQVPSTTHLTNQHFRRSLIFSKNNHTDFLWQSDMAILQPKQIPISAANIFCSIKFGISIKKCTFVGKI